MKKSLHPPTSFFTGRLALLAAAALVFIIISVQAEASSLRIAFGQWRGKESSVGYYENGASHTLIKRNAADPEISPNGDQIAFTLYGENGSRTIALCSIPNGKITRLRVSGGNSYGPRWSTDGKSLLYSKYVGGKRWLAAIYDIASGREKIITPGKGGVPAPNDLFSPFFSADGKSFWAQDMTNLYQFSLDGAQLTVVPLDPLFAKEKILGGSDIHFTQSTDGENIIFAVQIGETHCRTCQNPDCRSGVFVYNIKTGKLTNIPLKTICVQRASWLAGSTDELLFVLHSAVQKRTASSNINDICIYSIKAGKIISTPVKNAYDASSSR
ncbi:MAG: hypothetical protein RRY12_05895 [Cloacibacillus sp.]